MRHFVGSLDAAGRPADRKEWAIRKVPRILDIFPLVDVRLRRAVGGRLTGEQVAAQNKREAEEKSGIHTSLNNRVSFLFRCDIP